LLAGFWPILEDCDNFATNEVTGTKSAYLGGMFAAMTHARRQQYRHLTRSAGYALAAAAMLPVALSGSLTGKGALMAVTLVVLAGGLWLAASRSKPRAGRWRVGADSERAVRLLLNELGSSGWVVRNGVRWPGGGDIDHLVRSPDGLGFAIETKTLSFSQEHLGRAEATAHRAGRRRRRYPRGVIPVLCVVRPRRVEACCGDVVVVSMDRLLPVLKRLAVNTRHRGGPVLSPVRSPVPRGHDG
jgi:hypothetical protein